MFHPPGPQNAGAGAVPPPPAGVGRSVSVSVSRLETRFDQTRRLIRNDTKTDDEASELREMSDEQLALTLKETTQQLCSICGCRRRRNGSTPPASCASSAA